MNKIADVNNAKTIILDNCFFHIVIDKEKHTIIQTRQWNTEVNEDHTLQCEQMEVAHIMSHNNNPKCSNASYKGGVALSKVLNARADRKSVSYLNAFSITLE